MRLVRLVFTIAAGWIANGAEAHSVMSDWQTCPEKPGAQVQT